MDIKQQILHNYRVEELSLRDIFRKTGAASFRADSLLARELLQFHDMAAIPVILAQDDGTGIFTLDITAIDPIDTSSYDTSTSPLFRSSMMR